ncbi:MAG: 7-carboxy-7-deazaguanine synthase QueE [Bacteroidia bacterium]|nr:7-carboxy-7-deazaguanine synthase QueE [Bacteroidia bacterium]
MEYSITGLNKEQKELLESGQCLPVMEMFMTLQGEGYHTGLASFFIRIGGCDIGCHWCDVKESWDAEKHPLVSVSDILKQVKLCNPHTVVITGGEPVYWNLNALTSSLKEAGIKIHLETSAAYLIQGHFDWICLSPKKTKLPLEENWAKADELKVIVYNRHDFQFAEECRKKVRSDCKLYLQPEWSKSGQIINDIVKYIIQNQDWKLSLQVHKFIGIP